MSVPVEPVVIRPAELRPPLTHDDVVAEADCCLDCRGPHAVAPCTLACAAQVDVPAVVEPLARDDVLAAAEAIFAGNIRDRGCAEVSTDSSRAALVTRFGVEIDAPDGITALDLERRLLNLGTTAMTSGHRWFVGVSGSVDPEAVELVVHQWLNDIVEPMATMRIDGEEVVVKRDRIPGRPGVCSSASGPAQ